MEMTAAKTSYSTHAQIPQVRLTRKDYTVGWICALPIELAVVQEMLDEEHQGLPHDADDSNIYTFGRMGEHNVVIACLTAGQIGNNSAASAAVQMKSSFNAIRFGLMVGIGGSVLSTESDIRLGDVVISQSFNQNGGVVQYDFGMTTSSGFIRTGFLNAPPTILLNALSILPEFNRNKAGSDILFEATYKHVGGAECEECSRLRIVDRQPRGEEIMIHYGTIASGNQVMQDSAIRDRLSSELGGVLCFDMEAAGLMNNFPCLVVRGICDYADSHKNKRWQAYAAGTAAACAKEILSVIPAAKVMMEPTADEVIHRKDAACSAPWLVPFERNPHFTGRESQLARLEEKLYVKDRAAEIAITGLGGVGKTQLALELAYRAREKYENCSVIWMLATSMENLQQAYVHAAQQLGIHGWEQEKVNVKKLVQDHLGKESAGQWLLVFDNADDIDMWTSGPSSGQRSGRLISRLLDMWILRPGSGQRSDRLIDYLPRSKQGRTIFTTRDRKTAVELAQQNVIEIPEMDEHMAMQLLQKCLINPDLIDNEQDTKALLARLTYLPLAIVQAAAYINKNGIVLAGYLSLLADQEEEIIELLSEEFDNGIYSNVKNPVVTTWLISFEQIRHCDPLVHYQHGLVVVVHVTLCILERKSASLFRV
ncbi:hypothetical protein GP486_004529 [Trichoglossum hirsutum]|uniref:Nucleoside phosphorylase domain-containing protein n=1 Tax=Trichoglossum hirsutum TaxID=265104 RepID=A0A9P8RNX2_9PEZI|nr:hypothetical protein GP486_004529 [Trichoglossum hirsutum]